jgi:hypothetical protein
LSGFLQMEQSPNTLTVRPDSSVTIAYRQKVMRLEAEMRKMKQIEIPIVHYFSNGMYIREMHVPAGVTLTGKIHRTEHLCVLSKGEVSVANEHGIKTYKAPYTIASPSGVKRAVYAHEDAVWANLHRTDETDLDKLEAMLIAPTFEDLTWPG